MASVQEAICTFQAGTQNNSFPTFEIRNDLIRCWYTLIQGQSSYTGILGRIYYFTSLLTQFWNNVMMTHYVCIKKWSTCDYESIDRSFALAKNSDFHLEKNGVQKRKKNHEFNFRLKIDPHFYFHATWALLEEFETFDHFTTFFTLLFALFDPSKWVWPCWAKNLNFKYKYLNP